ncbi:MAG: hypothetical protein R6X02_13370 [Enhygromyxa sp.]
MRRIAAPCLIVLALGCKSPEEKACDNTVRIIEQSGATDGRPDANKSEKERRRDCLDSLGRLRQQIQPEEDVWFAYLGCLTAADSMKAQFDCLAPLTGQQQLGSADATQPER